MKKVISISLAVLMLLSVFAVMSASAVSSTKIKLGETTYYCKTGDVITYSVKMKTPAVIENGQFSVKYPSDLLTVKESAYNDIVGKPIQNYSENLKNEFRFNFSDPMEGYDFTSEQFFFSISFTVAAEGEGEIVLDKQIISDMNDKDVIASTEFKESINAPTSEAKTAVTLTKTSATIYTAATYKIKAKVVNGSGKTTYKSANAKIAKVSSAGTVTGVKKGKTTITVKNNGVSKKFTITVKNPSLKANSKSIKKGKSYTIKVNGSGTFKFASKNKKIATVNAKGKVTGKKKGSTKIIVTANGKKLTFTVKVI